MTTHTLNGAYILGAYPDSMAVEIARSHHERWDGSGYPYGLMEDMIPLSARIVTIADVYDALGTPRPYKDAWSEDDCLQYLKENSGSQFDPEVVAVFITNYDDILAVKEDFDDSQQEPVKLRY